MRNPDRPNIFNEAAIRNGEDRRKKAEIDLLTANRVDVRVWTSAANPNNPGETVGHVAIGIKGPYTDPDKPKEYVDYYSLWPSELGKRSGAGLIKPIHHELHNEEKDADAEQRPPERKFSFYTLNPAEIQACSRNRIPRLKGWSAAGLMNDSASCASFAWGLLQCGGIDSLVSQADRASIASGNSSVYSAKSSAGSSAALLGNQEGAEQAVKDGVFAAEMGISLLIPSPDALCEILEKAKRAEQERHPLTEQLPNAIAENRRGYCALM